MSPTAASDCWNPCHECGAYQLKPFTAESKLDKGAEYLVYNEPNDEWDIAQWDGAEWDSTIRNAPMYPVTHYQELPDRP